MSAPGCTNAVIMVRPLALVRKDRCLLSRHGSLRYVGNAVRAQDRFGSLAT